MQTTMERKGITGVYRPGSTHLVGDGFPVRNLFPSNDLGNAVSPFLLLDYAGPQYFAPTDQPRGVGEHPHRGFETVTLVYQGVVAHRDSAGHAGIIGPGDVQWMTAASGVVHEERHEATFARQGGTLEVIQLWVNLPAAAKMSSPRYQTLTAAMIPAVPLPDGAGTLRIVAGSYAGHRGPAHTVTPVSLYDLRLTAKGSTTLQLEPTWNGALFVLSGEVAVNGQAVRPAELAVFTPHGRMVDIATRQEATVLLLQGEPIREPVASYGPFVMNTKAELLQAVEDYQSGKMGRLT